MYKMFDPIFAQRYGIHAAVIIQDLALEIQCNQARNERFYSGRYWTYNSDNAFREMYPYMSKKKIDSVLTQMLNEGLILKRKTDDDKTLYAITDKGYRAIRDSEILLYDWERNGK